MDEKWWEYRNNGSNWESSMKGRIRSLNRNKMVKMDIIQNHRERQSTGRENILCRKVSMDLRSDKMLLDGLSFFLEALLSAVLADASFVEHSTPFRIFKSALIKFCVLLLPLWVSYSHFYFLCNVRWLIHFQVRSVH